MADMILGQKSPPPKPALWLAWDPETQTVQVEVDPEQVKTWDFARALTTMATVATERMAAMSMARQAHEAAQNQAIARQVLGNGRR